MSDSNKIISIHLRLKEAKLAYYLKKRYPEAYRVVKEVKERYGVTWNAVAAIVFGGLSEPGSSNAGTSAGGVDAVAKSVEELKVAVNELRNSLQDLQTVVKLLEWSILPRFTVDRFRCIYIDANGYYTLRDLPLPVPGLRLKEVETPNGKRYRINAYEHKLICTFCPFYKPRGESRW